MRLISEAVHEGAGAGSNASTTRRKRERASGAYRCDSLTDRIMSVRCSVLRSKRFSGAAMRSYFVSDEENSVLAADFAMRAT